MSVSSDPAPATRKMVKDPEVVLIDKISGLMALADPGQQRRVLNWLNDKYGPQPCAITSALPCPAHLNPLRAPDDAGD